MYLNLTCEQSKNCSSIKSLLLLLIIPLLFISTQTFGQAANIDQIRNSNTYSTNTSDPLWVNGNAGASNSHYVEGHSIAYRVLLTGLTEGKTYSIILGYDTKHSDKMALDYLTHYQRLLPHQPFGHAVETINPLRMESGSREYNMTVGAVATRTIPTPDPDPTGYWNNSANNTFTPPQDDGTPVDNQPLNSFTNLDNGDPTKKVMSLWNGVFIEMNYVKQESLVSSSAQAENEIRVKFQASSDSVLLVWGGHIASRTDWGFVDGVPRSAGGISGSPYHMRLERLFVYKTAKVGNKVCNADSCEVGIGNQDRSLSAAAVIAPPECPEVPSLTQCLESNSFLFNITSPDATTTYTWTIGSTNTANASIAGGSATGNSVTVVPVQGESFTGGSFTVNVSASKNGATLECNPVATGTVIDVEVDAEDADNVLQLDMNVSNSIGLGIQSISPGTTADYNYEWKLISKPSSLATASFTDLNSPNAGDATFNVLGPPHVAGAYTVRVIATQKVAPFCIDSSTVTIDVTSGVPCGVGGPDPVCPGSQDNVYFYDPNGDGRADAIPTNFTAEWTFDGLHPSAEFDGSTTGNTVKVDVAALGSSCNTSYTVKITLTSTSRIVVQSCTKTVGVQDTEPPVITQCPSDREQACGSSTLASITGRPIFTDNCGATADSVDVIVSNCNRAVIKRTWTVTDLCGNTASCVQLIALTDTEGPTINLNENCTLASLTDNCSATADIISYFKDVNGVRNWTAVDAAGNVTTKTCTLPALRESNPSVTSSSSIAEPMKRPVVNQAKVVEKNIIQGSDRLQVTANPNPFSDQVNFRFSSPVSGKAKLEIFTIVGQRIGVVYEGMVKAGVNYDVPYQGGNLKVATLVYSLRVNDKKVNGKLLRLK